MELIQDFKVEQLNYNIEKNIVSIGSEPESADYSNPEGSIYREKHYITATTPNGYIYSHNQLFNSEIEAQKLLDIIRSISKLEANQWNYERIQYGSRAYQGLEPISPYSQSKTNYIEDFGNFIRNSEAVELRQKEINNMLPRPDNSPELLSVTEEYKFLAKELQGIGGVDYPTDVQIAEQMFIKGYLEENIQKSIKGLSPMTVMSEKDYEKTIVHHAKSLPTVQKILSKNNTKVLAMDSKPVTPERRVRMERIMHPATENKVDTTVTIPKPKPEELQITYPPDLNQIEQKEIAETFAFMIDKRNHEKTVKRIEAIQETVLKSNMNRKERSPIKEYLQQAKKLAPYGHINSETDTQIAVKMFLKSYKPLEIQRGIREASPFAVYSEKTYAKTITERAAKLPEVQKTQQKKGLEI